jgi:hypothetical protein
MVGYGNVGGEGVGFQGVGGTGGELIAAVDEVVGYGAVAVV